MKTNNKALNAYLKKNPLATVAAVAGIGFVVAGGLGTPLGGRLLRVGTRLGLRIYGMPFLRERLVRLVVSSLAKA